MNDYADAILQGSLSVCKHISEKYTYWKKNPTHKRFVFL